MHVFEIKVKLDETLAATMRDMTDEALETLIEAATDERFRRDTGGTPEDAVASMLAQLAQTAK